MLEATENPAVKALALTVTVLDTETTGLDPSTGDRMLEIALVRLEGGQVTDEFHSLVNPHVPVTATEIHRITQGEVDGAPSFAEIAPAITARLQGTLVVGHNVSFDLGFLKAEYARAGLVLPPVHHACTREGARELLAIPRVRLGDCCEHLGIGLAGWHAALADTRATTELFVKLCDLAEARGRGYVRDDPWYATVVPTDALPSAPVVHRAGTPLAA